MLCRSTYRLTPARVSIWTIFLTHSFLTVGIVRIEWHTPCPIGTCRSGNSIAGRARRKKENMAKKQSIKASISFKRSTATEVLTRANAVQDGVFSDKDDYPNPPIDPATLKSQIEALSGGITAAMDGGKQAIAAREHLKEVVMK